MKRPLVATAVAVLGACDPCGRCGPCGQTASQRKQGGYYLSREGHVFYKDAQDREHTVNPPSEGLRVPRAAADPYREVRGYAGQQNGRDLRGLAAGDPK
jgi:hypothetical protein